MKMSSSIKHKLFIFDGDIIGYKVAWATQTDIDWGDNLTTEYNLEEAQVTADRYIENIMDQLRDPNFEGDEQVIIALSSTKNFRKDINPEYKLQRKGIKKPVVYHEVIKYLMDKYQTFGVERLEADDVMGILATKPYPEGTETTLVSIDKDMKTIPGRFYSSDKRELNHISELEADYNFYIQALTGDSIDNYKGIPGIGPVKAGQLLGKMDILMGDEDCQMWELVRRAYLEAGLTEDDAIMQCRMARILRHEDYKLDEQGELILWSPPHNLEMRKQLEKQYEKKLESSGTSTKKTLTTSGKMTATQSDPITTPSTK